MEKAYWLGRKQASALPNPYPLIMQRASILCAVAVPVVGFNVFASSQNDETILYWSLAITVAFTLFGSVFVVWAANVFWPRKQLSDGRIAR